MFVSKVANFDKSIINLQKYLSHAIWQIFQFNPTIELIYLSSYLNKPLYSLIAHRFKKGLLLFCKFSKNYINSKGY